MISPVNDEIKLRVSGTASGISIQPLIHRLSLLIQRSLIRKILTFSLEKNQTGNLVNHEASHSYY